MALESIDVGAAKAHVTNCLNDLKTEELTLAINGISSNGIWAAGARDNLKEAIRKLMQDGFLKLKNQLGSVSKMLALIEKYQKNRNQILDIDEKLRELREKEYYTETYTDYYAEVRVDYYGNEYYPKKTRRVQNYDVTRRINELRRKRDDLKEEMDKIKTDVENMSSSI